MNIDEITGIRRGWASNQSANASAPNMPTGQVFTSTTGAPVNPECEHDWNFLERVFEGHGDDEHFVGYRFYCRKCLEYREVKQ